MADVQESYPTPTSGVGAPCGVTLAGSGVTQIKGHVYQVSLSLAGTKTVTITPTAVDAAGTTASPAYTGAFNWLSYNAAPTSANAGDVIESYPASTSGKLGEIATVATATGATMVVTGQFVGQAIVECWIPLGDVTGLEKSGKVYAQLVVTVGV